MLLCRLERSLKGENPADGDGIFVEEGAGAELEGRRLAVPADAEMKGAFANPILKGAVGLHTRVVVVRFRG